MSTNDSRTAAALNSSVRNDGSGAAPPVRDTSQQSVNGNQAAPAVANAATNIANNDNDTRDLSDAKVEPPLLYKCVLSKHWNNVLTRLEEAPEEAKFFDDFGLSPLHRACYRDAPVNVITGLIEASPKEMLSIQDKCDFSRLTPLHAACHYCSPEVVKLLLEASTEALHRRNTKHQTPLECICQVYSNRIRHSLDRVAKDISEYDEAEKKRNESNENLVESNLSVASRRRPQYADLLVEDGALCRFFKVSCLLLQAQLGLPLTCSILSEDSIVDNITEQKTNYDAPNMVQACAMAAATIPTILLEMCLKIFPEHIKLPALQNGTSNTRAGNLALHEALECGGRVLNVGNCKKLGSNDKTLFRKEEIHYLNNFQMILDAYPHAVLVRNSLGEVPFITARRCGLTWSLGMQKLLQRNPEAFFHIPNLCESTICHILSKAGTSSEATSVSAPDDKVPNAKNEKLKKDEDAESTSLLLGLLKSHPGIMEHARSSCIVSTRNIKQPVNTENTEQAEAPEVSSLDTCSSIPTREASFCKRLTEENFLIRRSTCTGSRSDSDAGYQYEHRSISNQKGGARSTASRFSLTHWRSAGKDSNDISKKVLRRCQSAVTMANDAEPTLSFAPLASAKRSSKHHIPPMSLPWLVQKIIGSSKQQKRGNEQQCPRHTNPCACATEPGSNF